MGHMYIWLADVSPESIAVGIQLGMQAQMYIHMHKQTKVKF